MHIIFKIFHFPIHFIELIIHLWFLAFFQVIEVFSIVFYCLKFCFLQYEVSAAIVSV